MTDRLSTVVDVVSFKLLTGRFAMLAETVSAMAPLDGQNVGDDSIWLHELLQIDIDQNNYHKPCILIMAQPEPPLSAVVVDQAASHIVHLDTDHIHPLPAALACMSASTPIWATFLDGNEIVLLIDPFRVKNRIQMILDGRKPS